MRGLDLNQSPAPVTWAVLTTQEGALTLPRRGTEGPEWQAPRHPEGEQKPRQRRPQTPAQTLAAPSTPVLSTEDKAPCPCGMDSEVRGKGPLSSSPRLLAPSTEPGQVVGYLVPLLLDARLQGHQLLLQLVHRLLLFLQQRPLGLPLPLQKRPLHFSLQITAGSMSRPLRAAQATLGVITEPGKSPTQGPCSHLSGRLLQLLLQLLHPDFELLYSPQHLSPLLFQGQHLSLELIVAHQRLNMCRCMDVSLRHLFITGFRIYLANVSNVRVTRTAAARVSNTLIRSGILICQTRFRTSLQ